METTSTTADRLGHDTATIAELKVGLAPWSAFGDEVANGGRVLNVLTDETHVFKRLFQRVRENHDVLTRLESGNPQGVGHEEHGLAVVTRCFHAVVSVVSQSFVPRLVMARIIKAQNLLEEVFKRLCRHLSVHVVNKPLHVAHGITASLCPCTLGRRVNQPHVGQPCGACRQTR